jgi:hypothetical protein
MLSRPWKDYCSGQGKPPPAIMTGPLSVPTLANKIRTGSLDDEDQSTNVTSDRTMTAYRCYSRGRTRTGRSSRGRPWDNAYTGNAGTRCRGKSGCGPRSAIARRRSCARARHPSADVSPHKSPVRNDSIVHREIRGRSGGGNVSICTS